MNMELLQRYFESLIINKKGLFKMSLKHKLIKFTNYGDDFLKGNIYLNPLECYRGVEEIIKGNIGERNSAINDFLEGSVASVNVKDWSDFGLDFGDEIKNNLIGNVHLLSEDLKFTKLLCLYVFLYDKEKMAILQPDKRLRTFNAKEAIIIYDVAEFELRIRKALDKQETNIIGAKRGFVDYYENDEKTKLLGPFKKVSDFEWQNEFRFAFYEDPVSLDPTILKIGDISDIAIKVKSDCFIEDTVNFFKQYIHIF